MILVPECLAVLTRSSHYDMAGPPTDAGRNRPAPLVYSKRQVHPEGRYALIYTMAEG